MSKKRKRNRNRKPASERADSETREIDAELSKAAGNADSVIARDSRSIWIASVLLFVGVIAVYIHSAGFDFIYDDQKLILRQGAPQSIAEALSVFTERHWDDLPYYRPIARLTMVTQKALHGNRSGPFHAFNSLLMGICAVAAFWMLLTPVWRIPTWIAAAGAALFALHPVSSCTVYPICSGRETLIPAIFMIATMACWLRGGKYYWAAIFCLACALFSKEQAVVLPALMLAADLLKISPGAGQRKLQDLCIRFLPVVGITAVYFIIRSNLFHETNEHELAKDPLRPLQSVLFAIQSWVVPYVDLRYEPRWEIWFSGWRSAVGVFAIGLIIAEYFRWNRTNKDLTDQAGDSKSDSTSPHPALLFAFWIVWVAFSLATTSNIFKQEAFFAERYVFLALLGPLAVAAMVVARAFQKTDKRQTIIACMSILIIASAAISFHRGSYYATETAFLEQWEKVDPARTQASSSLGEYYYEQNDFAAAKFQFEKALNINPNDPAANNGLGWILVKEGKVNESLPLFERALQVKNNFPEAHNYYGSALAQLQRYEEAKKHLEIAIRQSSHYADPYSNLGKMYSEIGELKLARESFQNAIKTNPEQSQAYFGIALLDANAGKIESAANGFRKVTELDPEDSGAFINLGIANFDLGEKEKAKKAFERALELAPDSEIALEWLRTVER